MGIQLLGIYLLLNSIVRGPATVDVSFSVHQGVASRVGAHEMYWHVQRYLPIISMLRAVSVSLINSSSLTE